MNSSSIKMKKNSLTHDILMISKVYNKLISLKDLYEINNTKFTDSSKVRRSLLYLNLHNLISLNDNDTWIITPFGKSFLYQVVERNSVISSS